MVGRPHPGAGGDVILLFTDYGPASGYMGEIELILCRAAPEVPVVALAADAPAFRPDLAAYLLASRLPLAQAGDVIMAVVDPGVGTERPAVAILADGIWLVGPDNGLLAIAARRARDLQAFAIHWRPARLSASFHGRDLFAPVAARLARSDRSALTPATFNPHATMPDDLAAIVQLDAYGNAVTGLRADRLAGNAVLNHAGHRINPARTFADVREGTPFWYANSSGLAEIACNQAPAATLLGIRLGDPIGIDQAEIATTA